MKTASRVFMASLVCLALTTATIAMAGTYPPKPGTSTSPRPEWAPSSPTALLFHNTHTYAFGSDPSAVVIDVDLFDNYLGDFTKYWWVYTVHNNSYDPIPGTSNAFSGFELALPVSVPDIADISPAPPPWLVDCCSGLPVEWDRTDAMGIGVPPGSSGVFSFTTLPRFITLSTGWFHTWEFNSQTDIVSYPAGNQLECPDVLSPPVPTVHHSWGGLKLRYR